MTTPHNRTGSWVDEEDAMLRHLAAAGATVGAIGAAMLRDIRGVRNRARLLRIKIAKQPHPRGGRTPVRIDDSQALRRCIGCHTVGPNTGHETCAACTMRALSGRITREMRA